MAVKDTLILAVVVVGGLFVASKIFSDKVADFNTGTEFEDTGIVGALGNATDQASGGILSAIGSGIGQFFSSSIFDRRTLDDLTGT